MFHTLTQKMLAIAALSAAAFALGIQDANAGSWGSYGSDGGSYGSYGGSMNSGSYGSTGSYGSAGSYGGSGSHGSHGGGLLSRLASRIHSHFHHQSYGSGGSYGSSGSYGGGGSYGSYGSYGGSSGGYGSYGGSGGGSYGSYGSVETYKVVPDAMDVHEGDAVEPPAGGNAPAGEAAPEGGAAPAGDPAAYYRGSAILTVNVPMNAKVFVNGYETQTTGTSRSYVSRNLVPGFGYTYEVRAEMMVDGQKVEETKSVDLRAGTNRDLAFNFAPVANPVTTLTLNVPENAEVKLAGSQTKSTGAVRVFTTTKLAKGAEWSDYKIVVSIQRDGQLVTKEETISLKAGAVQSLNFDFTENRVAAAVR